MQRRLSLRRAKKDPFFAWRLSYGSFVSRTWKYLYMEAPKSGCTSTKAHISDLEQLPRRTPWPESVHERLPGGVLSLSDLDENEAEYFLTHRDVCRFYVYRDPVRRLISAFKDKILSDDEA